MSEAGVAACVSATHLVKHRPGFGHSVVPAAGSVLASPVTDTGAGEPDYFFHWLRDAALLMDAVLPLVRSGVGHWRQTFCDYVAFSLSLTQLDGRDLVGDAAWRTQCRPDFLQFLRDPAELAAITGDTVAGDVRFGADGQLDTIRWSRPQHDGPALEALVCLRALAEGVTADGIGDLIRRNLDYTLAHETADGVDIWEEQSGDHFYTRLLQHAALKAGAVWAARLGGGDAADHYADAAERLGSHLERFWSPTADSYVTRIPSAAGLPSKEFDSSTLLALLHAGLTEGPLAITGGRALRTLERLEAAFAAYPVNQQHRPGRALGRYIGDIYGTAGPWYLCTFAAAELRYRRAAFVADPAEAAAVVAAGDATLAMARETIPQSGALTEQFDPTTGEQSSARDLGWSHAALLTAAAARSQIVNR